MKPRVHTIQCLLAALLFMGAAGPALLLAAPTQNTKLDIQQSVFVYPENPSEGRDPFYPTSTRVFDTNPAKQNRGPALTDLVFRGILGGGNRILAVINDSTFAPGDKGDVITKDGRRLTISCVAINPTAGTATVEANGVSQVLHLSALP